MAPHLTLAVNFFALIFPLTTVEVPRCCLDESPSLIQWQLNSWESTLVLRIKLVVGYDLVVGLCLEWRSDIPGSNPADPFFWELTEFQSCGELEMSKAQIFVPFAEALPDQATLRNLTLINFGPRTHILSRAWLPVFHAKTCSKF